MVRVVGEEILIRRLEVPAMAPALCGLGLLLTAAGAVASNPVPVEKLAAAQVVVVAGHPEAAAAGVDILRSGGSAVDAAVAVSLSLGVAEPYGSGLGGKLMLLYYDAGTDKTFVVDGMDAAGVTLDAEAAAKWTSDERTHSWRAVAVPGLLAGLAIAHERWGALPWPELFVPAIRLADAGFTVLPKTRTLFEERIDRIRGDPTLRALCLPDGELPEAGRRLPNTDLAASLKLIARDGPDAFYRGPIASAIAESAQANGGVLTVEDFAAYQARIVEPVRMTFSGYELVGSPPPTTGAVFCFPTLKALEDHQWTEDEFRTPGVIVPVARAWSAVLLRVYQTVADDGHGREAFAELLSDAFIKMIQSAAGVTEPVVSSRKPAMEMSDALADATTHFVVIDPAGNIVCATQSLSLHFGAGVIAPGTGIILNDTMSNFSYQWPDSPNQVAPGQRPRSTIAPMIVFRAGRPVLALGVPGGSRIPTAMLQVLMDRLVFGRPLDEAMADTRIHIDPAMRNRGVDAIETEEGLDETVAAGLAELGWTVEAVEPAGTGLHFGGFAAVEILPDGTRVGYADTRRTNAVAGY